MPKAAACRERCFDGVREVLNAMKVNRTLLCERESPTADVADLVPARLLPRRHWACGWSEHSVSSSCRCRMADWRLAASQCWSRGGVSAHQPIICTVFSLVNPANSQMLVSQSARVSSLDSQILWLKSLSAKVIHVHPHLTQHFPQFHFPLPYLFGLWV